MSLDSPAKQHRVERHLMRQRGAGVRTVSANFGFSIGTSSLPTSSDATPTSELPPSKRRKTIYSTTSTDKKTEDVCVAVGRSVKSKKRLRALPVDEDGSTTQHVNDGDDSFVFEQSKRPKDKNAAVPDKTVSSSHDATVHVKRTKARSTRPVDCEVVAATVKEDDGSCDELELKSEVKRARKKATKRASAKSQKTTASISKSRSTEMSSKRSRLNQKTTEAEQEDGEEPVERPSFIAAGKPSDNNENTREHREHQFGAEQPAVHTSKASSKGSGRSSRKLRAAKDGRDAMKSVMEAPDLEDAPQHNDTTDRNDDQLKSLANSKPQRQTKVGLCRRFDSSAAVTCTSVICTSVVCTSAICTSVSAASRADGMVETKTTPDDPASADQQFDSRRRPLSAMTVNTSMPPPSPGKPLVLDMEKPSEDASQHLPAHQSIEAQKHARSPRSQRQKQNPRSATPIQVHRPTKAYEDQHSKNSANGESSRAGTAATAMDNGATAQTHAQDTSATRIARPESRETHQRKTGRRQSQNRSQNNGLAKEAETSEAEEDPAPTSKFLGYPSASRGSLPIATRQPNPRQRPLTAFVAHDDREPVEMNTLEYATTKGDVDVDWLLEESASSQHYPAQRPPPVKKRARHGPVSSKQSKNMPEMDLDDLIFSIASIAATQGMAKPCYETAVPTANPRSRSTK